MKSKNLSEDPPNQCRLDIWLWSSRFYKTRKIATEAINGGHVSINGQKGKPGKSVRIQDRLIIKKNFQRFHIEVVNLSTKRLSAPLAQQLYQETPESEAQRELETAQRKKMVAGLTYDQRKPNKRNRKQMMKLKRDNLSSL